MATQSSLIISIDVESVGLHGEGFAFGYVVINRDGTELESGCFACDPAAAKGTQADRGWIKAKLPLEKIAINCATPQAVRAAAWKIWRRWAAKGAQMIADCAWPVEARFLAACVDDVGASAASEGPYPLLDVSTLRAAARQIDPSYKDPDRAGTDDSMADPTRDEFPNHHPTADARYAARLWRHFSALNAPQ